jgi:hypothetical protein
LPTEDGECQGTAHVEFFLIVSLLDEFRGHEVVKDVVDAEFGFDSSVGGYGQE